MAKATTLKDAIKLWEEKNQKVAAEEEKVELYGQIPPIEKLDATLSTLKACKRLSLSTNSIEKITSLSGMDNLKILSLGRNLIKKLENLDAVADSLEELWISYNQLASLAGIEKLGNLKILYASNNKVASWNEIERLKDMNHLEELLLVGNPLYNENAPFLVEIPQQGAAPYSSSKWRLECIKRLPQLKKLDGIPVLVEEKDLAASGEF